MTRGGRSRDRDEPERRCIATGASGPTAPLVRFVLGPEGIVVPDLLQRLPGRGAWVTANRAALERAATRGLFSRAFRTRAEVPSDLLATVEAGLARRTIDGIALARKAGLATTGFDAVKARLKAGPVAALIEAADGSEPQRAKLRPLAGGAPRIDRLTSQELGLAFGREFVIHACFDPGGAAERAMRDHERLAGFRPAIMAVA